MSSFDSTEPERSKKAAEALLEELRSSSREEKETTKSLDTKATTMITISATTTSLLIAFATALLSRIKTDFPFFNYVAILLVVGLILTIVSIVIFLISARPRGYFSALTTQLYFKRGKEGGYIDIDQERLNQIIYLRPDVFTKDRIKEYLLLIQKNSIVNEVRTRIIYKGELVFVANIVVILISIMLQLQAVLQGYIIQP